MTWQVIQASDDAHWISRLARCSRHDVYHLPGYHLAYERPEDTRARAYVAEIGGETLFHPVMIRPIRRVGKVAVDRGWHDIETVYGYSGPLATSRDPEFLAEAWTGYETWCQEQNVVCEFLRFNPLLGNHWVAAPGCEIWTDRQTVVIDLSNGEDAVWRDYAATHRNRVRRARKNGLVCEQRPAAEALPSFRRLYEESMQALDADPFYFFSDCYFETLIRELGDGLRLFMVSREGEDIAGALFLVRNGTIHYHLGGSSPAQRHLAPNNLLFHEVALRGIAEGLTRFHLGGGRSASPDDSLLTFKARFSRERCDFHLGTRVHDAAAYDWLVARWREQSAGDGLPSYLQLYRLDPTRQIDGVPNRMQAEAQAS